MIEFTIFILRALVVLPIALALRDIITSINEIYPFLPALPFIDPDLAALILSLLIVLIPALLGRPGFVIKLTLVVYLMVPILLGTLQNLMAAFGIDYMFPRIEVKTVHLVYMIFALIFVVLLEEVERKYRLMKGWEVEGLDPALHFQLAAGVVGLVISGALAMFYVRSQVLELTLPEYSLLAVIMAIGPVVALGILPPKSKKTVLVVKDTAEVGPSYEVYPRERDGKIEIEIRDSGVRQERELVHSFEIKAVPKEVVLKVGERVKPLTKSGEVVVDGVRYVVYSGGNEKVFKP